MHVRNLAFCVWPLAAALLSAAIGASSAPRPFRVYLSLEPADAIELPAGFNERTEWTEARLMYPSHPNARFTSLMSDWREGGTSWSQDYPRADRHFAEAVRRLTRVHARRAEQPVNPDDPNDIYNWPWLVAGEMGDWKLTDAQAQKVREYLLRGGFLMLDDFWGTEEWNRFNETMHRIFPDRVVVDLENSDSVFHTVYDLDDRYQIPGEWALSAGTTYRNDGKVPHWRGIYDDKGRLMVAISFNSDVGDSWEWSDDPEYPAKYAALGMRLGVNDVVYSMTH